jgi:hypothetical protein
MLAAEKHKGTFIAPVGIGLSLFIAELTGVYFTGGSVNVRLILVLICYSFPMGAVSRAIRQTREYEAERRPYSESPAPPHPNDQNTGLAKGDMHANELIKPTHSAGRDSD